MNRIVLWIGFDCLRCDLDSRRPKGSFAMEKVYGSSHHSKTNRNSGASGFQFQAGCRGGRNLALSEGGETLTGCVSISTPSMKRHLKLACKEEGIVQMSVSIYARGKETRKTHAYHKGPIIQRCPQKKIFAISGISNEQDYERMATKQFSANNQGARLCASSILGRSVVGRGIDKAGQGGAITSWFENIMEGFIESDQCCNLW